MERKVIRFLGAWDIYRQRLHGGIAGSQIPQLIPFIHLLPET